MQGRAWRLALGAALLMLGVLTLVLWHAPRLSGGWSSAMTVTGALAVTGLMAAAVLAAAVALRPVAADEVVVAVPVSGAPTARVQASTGGSTWLRAALAVAAVSALPALVVMVLSSSSAGGAVAAAAAPAPPSALVAPSPGPPEGASTAAAPEPLASGAAPPEVEAASPVAAAVPPVAAASGACQRVVAAGDTLWDLAAERLGPGASVADVSAATLALHRANTLVVGPDPDLIHPGAVLSTCL